jgi:hypothetical protein
LVEAVLVKLELDAFRKTKPSEYALRFFVGGCITVATGLIAMKWGPVVGGLFLAFPAIFPASATLVQKHEEKGSNREQPHSTTRGRRAAGLDATGSSIGSIGLLVFAVVVWRLIPSFGVAAVVIAATIVWLLVSVALWYIRRRVPRWFATHFSKRRSRTGVYSGSSNH